MPGFPDTKVIDAIMASAAAPVYFPAHDVPRVQGGNAFVDGGVFANNPSTAALAALIGSRVAEGIPPALAGRAPEAVRAQSAAAF